jgi:hypothetical protein
MSKQVVFIGILFFFGGFFLGFASGLVSGSFLKRSRLVELDRSENKSEGDAED